MNCFQFQMKRSQNLIKNPHPMRYDMFNVSHALTSEHFLNFHTLNLPLFLILKIKKNIFSFMQYVVFFIVIWMSITLRFPGYTNHFCYELMRLHRN